MSKYDKASLVMIPSAVKAETLYSVLPVNGDGDFTHDRNNGTATRVNKDGYIETVAADVPRLDYPLIDGVVQDCPSLLLEPSRTNIIQYSDDFSSWTSNVATITSNDIISPDGTQNADKLTSTNAYSSIYISGITATSGSKYTLSCFFKNATSDEITLRLVSTNDSRYVFNLSDYSVRSDGGYTSGFVSAKIESFPNDWHRCSLTFTTATTTIGVNIYPKEQDFVGENSVNLWGAQLELGSYATSYIPNDGTTATVTRNADVCDSAGTSAEFNDSEGVLYAEIAALADDLTFRLISLSDGTTSNRLSLGYRSTSNAIYCEIRNANATQAFLITTINDIKTKSKVSVKYKENDFAMWVNGFEVSTDASGITPVNLSQINFDSGQQAGSFFYGRTKELATFKEALTDSELEALTSWDSFTEMATGQEYSIR